jgi:transposase
VIKHFLNGDSEREIAQKILIPRATFYSMIVNCKSIKCIGALRGRGRKRKTTVHIDQIIQRKIKVDHRKVASSVEIELENELGGVMSTSTVRRRAHEVELYGRVAHKKPYMNKVNRGKHIQHAVTYREKPLGFWNQVLWSDETKFNLFGSDGMVNAEGRVSS